MNFQSRILVILLGSCVAGADMSGFATAQDITTWNTRTLEQVKAAGALRSSYRKPIPQAKSSETPQANLESFRAEIEPTLKKACYECHGSETAEGEFRVDTLDPDLLHGEDVDRWLKVSAAVGNSEMPPEDGPELADDDRSRIIAWLSSEIQIASQLRRTAPGNSSFRRMTRYEYNCFYLPNGVPMPRKDDPAYETWSWFPQGTREDFRFSKCLDPLEPLRDELTVLSGLSHPSARRVHGHSNADQFLTGADTGGRGDYKNSISLDQVYAAHVGEQTRISSLVMSTDGGTKMGFKHGQYLDYAGAGAYRGGWAPGDTEPYKLESTREDLPLSNLYVTMLQRLGVETETFAGNTGTISEV